MASSDTVQSNACLIDFTNFAPEASQETSRVRLAPPHASSRLDRDQGHPGGVNEDLAGVLEIDRDPVADGRLHLAEAPIGLVRVAHQHAGRQVLARLNSWGLTPIPKSISKF